MLRDKRDSSDMNANKIKTLIGKYEEWQSLSSFTFWDDDNKEYGLYLWSLQQGRYQYQDFR